MRDDRGEMLERHGRGDVDDRRPALGDRQPLGHPLLELGQIIASVGGALVERVMLAAVDRFLRGEALDLFGELGRGALAERPHAFDEIGFADREGRGQRVVNSGRFDAPAVPQSRSGRIPAETAVARRDAEIGRSRQGRCSHGWDDIINLQSCQ